MIAYWSNPLTSSAYNLSWRDNSNSTAPAPGNNLPSLHNVLTPQTPSSIDLSKSFITFSVAARITTVAIEVSSSCSWLIRVTFLPLISITSNLKNYIILYYK